MLGRVITIGSMAAAFGLLAPSQGTAQAMQHPKGVKRTITGTAIDVSCKFGQGLTGAGHRECAQVCAGKGIPLAILGKDGKLYVPASTSMPGEPQNDRLKDFAEQEVTVTGTVFPAGGASAIWIENIARKS